MLSHRVCFLAHNTSCIHIHVPRAGLTAAMIPRSVTMALALPIAHQLHASAGITALGVMLTGQSFGAPLPNILTNNISSSGVGWGWGGGCFLEGTWGLQREGGGGRGGYEEGSWGEGNLVEAVGLHATQHRSVCSDTEFVYSPWTLRW